VCWESAPARGLVRRNGTHSTLRTFGQVELCRDACARSRRRRPLAQQVALADPFDGCVGAEFRAVLGMRVVVAQGVVRDGGIDRQVAEIDQVLFPAETIEVPGDPVLLGLGRKLQGFAGDQLRTGLARSIMSPTST
jgi:hypothetical protein